MAKTHGKNALIYFGSLDCSGQMNTWSITPAIKTAEVSAFGDDWDAHLEGTAGWTSAFAGFFDAAGLAAKVFDVLFSYIGAQPKILLIYPQRATGGNYFYGTAILTGIPVTGNRNDAVALSTSLQGTAQLRNFSF